MSAAPHETPVNLSSDQAAEVIRHLNDKIRSLESRLARQQRDAAEDVSMKVAQTIRHLRLHEVILLHTGLGRVEDLVERMRDPVVVAALGEVWDLNNAPFAQELITHVRAATRGGMKRF